MNNPDADKCESQPSIRISKDDHETDLKEVIIPQQREQSEHQQQQHINKSLLTITNNECLHTVLNERNCCCSSSNETDKIGKINEKICEPLLSFSTTSQTSHLDDKSSRIDLNESSTVEHGLQVILGDVRSFGVVADAGTDASVAVIGNNTNIIKRPTDAIVMDKIQKTLSECDSKQVLMQIEEEGKGIQIKAVVEAIHTKILREEKLEESTNANTHLCNANVNIKTIESKLTAGYDNSSSSPATPTTTASTIFSCTTNTTVETPEISAAAVVPKTSTPIAILHLSHASASEPSFDSQLRSKQAEQEEKADKFQNLKQQRVEGTSSTNSSATGCTESPVLGRRKSSTVALMPRRVSFPKSDSELVTGYLEPANPWQHGKLSYFFLHITSIQVHLIRKH